MESGAELVSFTPRRENLEEFFIDKVSSKELQPTA
jgi:hypothetical protein